MANQSRESLHQVLRTVASPLRFFAVAAVALTAIIVVLGWKSSLPAELTATLIIVAFGALILLILCVTLLVIFYPKKLVFDQEAHLSVLRERLGDSELAGTYYSGQLPASEPPPALPHKGGK